MEKNRSIRFKEIIPAVQHGEGDGFLLIAGPCVIENRETTETIAEHLSQLSSRYQIPLVFKASYRKANRSRLDSFTGIGDQEALALLKEIGHKHSIPVITDVHSPEEAELAAEYVDILQVPAFLSRQTDLLIACASTGKTVSIKKGQFLSPGSISHVVEKATNTGNRRVMITERGTSFGYQDLLVDFRGIPQMQKLGFPVILDVTHSLQQPNQDSGVTGGQPELIEYIARAGIAVGADGIFLETHPDPASAKSDGANMLPLHMLERLLNKLLRIREVVINM